MPPPQPIKARKSPEQATPILERWGWCIRNSVRPHLVGSYPGLLNFSWLQCLLGYLIWCTRPLLQCDLAAQTLELGKGFFLLLCVAYSSIRLRQVIPSNLIVGIECDSPLQMG